MIQILGKPECPFCWKVRLALSEAALPHHSLAVDPATPEGRETLARHSPQGTVPVMIDGPVTLWESSIMVEYAADLKGPGVTLLPGDAVANARARSTQYYSDRIVGPSLRAVVFEKRNKPESEWDAERIREGTDGWVGCQDHLEKLLDGRDFFAGDGFSIAECALIPRFGLAERYGVGVTAKFPGLARWFAAMKARPSYAATIPEIFTMPGAPGSQGSDIKRPFKGMVPPT
jgi:glutathione S-transferase